MKELKKPNSIDSFEVIDLEEKLDFCNIGCNPDPDGVCHNNGGCECTIDGGCDCTIDAGCFNKICPGDPV